MLVSDQPYTTEDGFLPVSPSLITMRREGETTTAQENLWENVDVLQYHDGEGSTAEEEEEEELEEESRRWLILGVMTEPEPETFVFRDRVLVEERKNSEEKDSSGFSEDGSGYEVEENFLESGEEEGFEGWEGEKLVHLNHQKEGEVLRNRVQLEQLLSHDGIQREVQLLNSKGEEERRKYTGRSEEAESTRASEVEKRNDDLTDVVDDEQLTWYFTWR